MKNLKKTEFIILIILWTASISTYTIAVLNNYDLFTSDYLGLFGLTTCTILSLIKPEKSLVNVFILLLLGLFNILSFAYFINVVFTFGFSIFVTPGIQLISLILLGLLTINRRNELASIYQKVFGQTEEEIRQSNIDSKNRFKVNFTSLSDHEIESKLQEDLVPEAIVALNEIYKERNLSNVKSLNKNKSN